MKPAFKLTVNGSDITALVADRLLQLTLTDESGVKSDRLEIVIDDRDQRLSIPPKRATMTVAIGYASGPMVPKGTYVIEEIELEGPERRMILRGNAAGPSKGPGAALEKSWDDKTLKQIASTIAGKHGWTPRISAGMGSIHFPHIDQQENDLQFLSRLVLDNGGVAKVIDNKLIIAEQGKAKAVSGQPLPRITITAGEVSDWSANFTERGNYTGVKAVYHDLDGAERGEEVAGGGDGGNIKTMPHTYSTKAAAKRAAKSKQDQLQRGKNTFSIGSMVGNPLLAAESRIVATGFRAGVDNNWTVVQATHTITETNYTTSLQCETPID